MKARGKQAAKSIWSPRSQRSWLKQLELEGAREKVRKLIAFSERRITEGKEKAKTQTVTAAGGSFAIQQALSSTLSDIANRERELSAYREREQSLTAEIDALTPGAAQAAQRAKHQAALAALALKRYTQDAAVDSILQEPWKALQQRAALTSKMLEVAPMVDFAATTDFDLERFTALERALPTELLAQSHAWLEHFLGQEGEKEPYTIGSKGAVLPETLADSGVYRPGDCVYLSAERAKMLPCDDAPKALPTPEEMEASARPAISQDDSFPVSGFLVR
jgi:hypothetical protein